MPSHHYYRNLKCKATVLQYLILHIHFVIIILCRLHTIIWNFVTVKKGTVSLKFIPSERSEENYKVTLQLNIFKNYEADCFREGRIVH